MMENTPLDVEILYLFAQKLIFHQILYLKMHAML